VLAANARGPRPSGAARASTEAPLQGQLAARAAVIGVSMACSSSAIRQGHQQLPAAIAQSFFHSRFAQKQLDQARFQGAVCLTSARLRPLTQQGLTDSSGEGSESQRSSNSKLRRCDIDLQPHRRENPEQRNRPAARWKLGQIGETKDLLGLIDHQQAWAPRTALPPSAQQARRQRESRRLASAAAPGWSRVLLAAPEIPQPPAPSQRRLIP